MTGSIDQRCIDTLRFLSVDMVQKADSGHPGLPLGAAPMAYALWQRHLKHNPVDPAWINRDRFVLSAGHGSALLYSLLAYGAWFMHRRVPWFSIGGQVLHVLPLFALAQAVVIAARLATGAAMPGSEVFLQWLTTALLWPVADLLLLAPQRRAAARDEHRPL